MLKIKRRSRPVDLRFKPSLTNRWYMSRWRFAAADPRNVKVLRKIRTHLAMWLIHSVLAIALVAKVALAAHDHVVQTTMQKARIEALTTFESTYKERLLQNKEVLSKACTSWWFDMTHQDRKLDVPARRKK